MKRFANKLVAQPMCALRSSMPLQVERAVSPSSLRKLVVAVSGVAVCALSSVAVALGLGDLSSQSYLGQPLKAKVDLINLNADFDTNYLFVRSINAAEAEQMGAEIYYGTHQLKVDLVRNDGKLYVEVLTSAPVKEPYLSVLLELRWPSGVVYREYPILLDPAPAITAPAQERVVEQKPLPTPQPTAQRPATTESSAARDIRSERPEIVAGEKYRVQPGDNLSIISARLAKGTARTLVETNEWLFENNPRAFINNDMDRLVAGAVLSLPDLTALQDAADQKTESSQKSVASTPVAVSLDENAAQVLMDKTDANASEDVRGLMTVSTTADDRAREMIDMLSRENENLRARMQKMESSEYLTTIKELVLLQQQQIKELQAKLGESEANEANAEMEAMIETIGIEKAVVVGNAASEPASADNTLTKQELLRELNNNKKNIDVEGVNKQAIIEVEPQDIEAMVDKADKSRSRLITILFIVGGILAALFSAMLFYYRKMIADSTGGKFEYEEDLPPLEALSVAAPLAAQPAQPAAKKELTREKSKEDPKTINYDAQISEHYDMDSKELDSWYGEQVTLDDYDKNMEQAFEEINQEFANLELDEEFLNAAREDIAETSLEALTEELPLSSTRTARAEKLPRRSDAEVKLSIAEKMAQYSEDGPNENSYAMSALELDEIEHFEEGSNDEIETLIQRALMYCEFKKFDKATHVIKVKMETDNDPRLSEALSQIDSLQVELEKKNAS